MQLLSPEALFALERLLENWQHVIVGRHSEPLYGYFCTCFNDDQRRNTWDGAGHGWTPDEAILSHYLYGTAEWDGKSRTFVAERRPATAKPLQLSLDDSLRVYPIARERERVIQLGQ